MTGSAVLAVDGRLVPGLVTAPDAALGLFVFMPDEPEAFDGRAEEGSLVRIRWRGSAGFDAEAEIVELEDEERWILSVPQQLAPAQQRQSPRVLADGAWTFVAEDKASLDVYDLSARGLGLEFPAGEGPAKAGVHIEGELRGAGFGRFSVRLECTNVRAHPDDDHLWIVGGRLVIPDEAARQRYLQALTEMGV